MGIQGTNLKDKNIRLRFFMIFFMGLIATAAIFYWRQVTLDTAEYVDFSTAHKAKASHGSFKSSNYQMEIEDVSPAAQ